MKGGKGEISHSIAFAVFEKFNNLIILPLVHLANLSGAETLYVQRTPCRYRPPYILHHVSIHA